VGKPVTISALMQSGRRIKVRGTLVAHNLATHRPACNRAIRRFDVTQISSGRRVGRFVEQDYAAAFARTALLLVPQLGTDEDLTDDQTLLLSQIRETYGGSVW
jgi:hypothetical protein